MAKNIKTASKIKKAGKLFETRNYRDALELYSKVTDIDPRDAESAYMCGVIYGIIGEQSRCIEKLRKAVELRPRHASSQYNLGVALRDSGQLELALQHFNAAIELKPDSTDSHNARAHALMSLGQYAEAIRAYEGLVRLDPGQAEIYVNLGTLHQSQGHINNAIDCFKQALTLRPGIAAAWHSLGNALVAAGRFDEALEAYDTSLQKDPNNAGGHSNMLLSLNYMPDRSAEENYQAHLDWAAKHADNIKPMSLQVVKDGSRKIRIGYLSQDFREHSVAYFIEPVLVEHNRDQYTVVCYSSVPRHDDTTKRLQAIADEWRDIDNISPADSAKLIAEDNIDILVDLSGHTAARHMAILARKPAPMQITWIGYPNTTGMKKVDYRLVDAYTDPEDGQTLCSETLLRLPACFLCYKPPENCPEVVAPPQQLNGYVTFGSFNNFSKLNATVISLWCRVLQAVPGSKLFIKNPALSDPKICSQLESQFSSQGISNERLILSGHTPGSYEHLELYNKIDIALDTFPYNGTTTTCEALWMGVPVVAMYGHVHHAERVGLSLLTNCGLDDLVANSENDYLNIATGLAEDIDKLTSLRNGLRDRLKQSSLCDAPKFTTSLERCYRESWMKLCDTDQQ